MKQLLLSALGYLFLMLSSYALGYTIVYLILHLQPDPLPLLFSILT